MRSHVRGSLVATMALTFTLLAGCGGDDGGSDGGDAPDDGFADLSATEMSAEVKDAMGDLEAVSIDGALTTDGQEIEIAMSLGEGGNCTGSFTTQGATAEILGVEGTTWFRPDDAFWTLFAGAEVAPQIIEATGDKWVTLPADDTSFKPFCDLEEFLGGLIDETDATYTKGETTEIDGEQTIELISERETGTSSGYALVEGDHYLVKIEKTEGEDPGTVTFSDFDEQPDVEAPADDEQVTLEDLQSGSY